MFLVCCCFPFLIQRYNKKMKPPNFLMVLCEKKIFFSKKKVGDIIISTNPQPNNKNKQPYINLWQERICTTRQQESAIAVC